MAYQSSNSVFIKERMMVKYRDLKEDITQISVLEENASAEAQLLQVESRRV